MNHHFLTSLMLNHTFSLIHSVNCLHLTSLKLSLLLPFLGLLMKVEWESRSIALLFFVTSALDCVVVNRYIRLIPYFSFSIQNV
jgi:hypothetical protein